MLKQILTLSALILSLNTFACSGGAKNSTDNKSKENTQAAITKEIEIKNAWIRAAKGKNTAAYFAITNNSDHKIEIIKASANGLARKIELHETYKEIVEGQEILKMRSVDKIVVPANTTIEFKPKSTHIMCMGLLEKLEKGHDDIKLTLTIDNQGTLQPHEITLPVRNAPKGACKCKDKKKTKKN